MNYPESEIRRVLKEQRYWSVSDDELIKAMKSCSDSDRDRIRMELWCKLYSYLVPLVDGWDLQAAMNDFDKQFPNV